LFCSVILHTPLRSDENLKMISLFVWNCICLHSTQVRWEPSGSSTTIFRYRVFTLHSGQMRTEKGMIRSIKLEKFTLHSGQMRTDTRRRAIPPCPRFTLHSGQMRTEGMIFDDELEGRLHSTQVRWELFYVPSHSSTSL